jgi:hypothetical protein
MHNDNPIVIKRFPRAKLIYLMRRYSRECYFVRMGTNHEISTEQACDEIDAAYPRK